MSILNTKDLFAFIDLAQKSTYPAKMPPLEKSERKDFIEWEFAQGDWNYRDSYTGFIKSVGQEIVRYKNEIIWANSYCGGMTTGNEDLAKITFDFLKDCIVQDEPAFQSVRGPKEFARDQWRYLYTQQGDISNYVGYEQIFHDGELVFFHRTIGGTVATINPPSF